MAEYGFEFLKEKGFFETATSLEDEYDTGKAVSYLFDPKNRLAYFDSFEKEDIPTILSAIRKKRTFDYYWFWKDGRLFAYRTFGENKQFIFNTSYSRRTDYVKSKEDKLSKFSSSNPTALFEVKDVISRFYRNLWELRLKLARAVKGGFSDRDRILAAQRLLDRLIFTYFLAEKGIIYGIDKRGKKQEISARKLFGHLIRTSEDFRGLLNDIFFDYLNNPKKNDMPIKGAEGYSLFIPYLNGGLFRDRKLPSTDRKNIQESKLKIEGFDWSELIGELNKYNWIIEYSSSEEEETIGNLTPEILGHIYEKFVITVSELDDIDVSELETTPEGELKKGNKKIGAYYTPEVITNYIAENTIFPFAADRLGLGGKYENFNAFYEAHRDDPETLSRFNSVLKDIKILDPAVGSGAFLMATADLLFDWRRKCGETLDDYTLRRDIIINNLYGVDIMEGAVEICMLRLWLWLIAAADPEKEIDALPNIEFNIFEGNSLIGYVDTHQVADIKMKKGKKKKAWKSFDVQYAALDNWNEDSILNLFKRRNEKIKEYKKATGKRAEELRNEIQSMTEDFKEILNGKLLSELQAKGIDIDEEGLRALKPFHWVMEFSDVFEKGGFDVVIGNPPYIRVEKLDNILADIYKRIHKSVYRRCDIYVAFIEKSFYFINKNGKIGLITSNQYTRAEYGIKLRKLIFNNYGIYKFIDFTNYSVFEGISTYPSIIIAGVERYSNVECVSVRSEDAIDEILSKGLENSKNRDILRFTLNFEVFGEDIWLIIPYSEQNLRKKISRICEKNTLKDFCLIGSPLTTGKDGLLFAKIKSERFDEYLIKNKNIDSFVEKKIWKKLIRPKNIKKWHYVDPEEVVFFPYIEKNDTFKLLEERKFMGDCPKTYKILSEHKEALLNRKDSRKTWRELGRPWYSLHRVGIPKNYNDPKILINSVVKGSKFCIDQNGYMFPHGGVFGINPLKIDIYFLLGYLNSKLAYYYLSLISPPKRGGYISLDVGKISQIPIFECHIKNEVGNFLNEMLDSSDRISLEDSYEKTKSIFKEKFSIIEIGCTSIRELARRILDSDDDKEIEELEKLIDKICYDIFDLSSEEIKIVEGEYSSE